MKPDTTNKALLVLASLWNEANKKTISAQLPEIDLTATKYTRKLTPDMKRYLPGDFVQVDPVFLKSLKINELKMATIIMADIHKNNALWHFEYLQNIGRDQRTILGLRKKKLLFETDIKNIHIVNPFLIRRGQIQTVIATTNELLEKKKKLTLDLIKNLKPPDDSSLSGYYALQV